MRYLKNLVLTVVYFMEDTGIHYCDSNSAVSRYLGLLIAAHTVVLLYLINVDWLPTAVD